MDSIIFTIKDIPWHAKEVYRILSFLIATTDLHTRNHAGRNDLFLGKCDTFPLLWVESYYEHRFVCMCET